MATQEQLDLFEIKFNETGQFYARKFIVWIRVFIVLNLLITCIHICSTILSYRLFDPANYEGYPYMVLQMRLMPYYTPVFCILVTIQMILYWKVAKNLKKGINYQDEQAFNESFRLLYRYSILLVISMLLSFIVYGLELLTYITW